MKPRFRPFGNLFHQFIAGTEFIDSLDWFDVAEALQRRGLIRFMPDKHGAHTFAGYVETEAMRSIEPERFEETIRGILYEVARTKEKTP